MDIKANKRVQCSLNLKRASRIKKRKVKENQIRARKPSIRLLEK